MKFSQAYHLIDDLVNMNNSRKSLPVWVKEETRKQVLSDTRDEFETRKKMLIDLIKDIKFEDVDRQIGVSKEDILSSYDIARFESR